MNYHMKKASLFIGIAALFASTSVQAAPQLSIEQARSMALQNNLDLKVSSLDPAIAATSLSEEEARFEAAFTGNLSYTTSTSTISTIVGGLPTPTSSRFETLQATGGISIPLRTGGTIQFNVPIQRSLSPRGSDLFGAFNGPDGTTPSGSLLAPDYAHPSQEGNDRIRDLLLEVRPA